VPAQAPEDRAGRERPGHDAPPRDGRAAGEAAAGTEPAGEGRPLSDADGINRIKAAAGEWLEPHIAARIADDVLRRIRDDGVVRPGPVAAGAGPVYNTYISDAHVAGSLNVGGRDPGGAGRDLSTGRARVRTAAAKRARQVTPGELELVKDIYARPVGIKRAESVFQARQLAILRGTRGSGLRTAGLWLAATYAATERVFFLSPGRLLAALRGGELEKDAAYVVPGLDAATAARLSEDELADIEDWISDGGWLVITVSSSVSLHRDLVSATDLVVDEIGLPDPVAVTGGHGDSELRKLALPAEARAELVTRLHGWLADEAIGQWLRERPEPRLAAQAGRALARTARDDLDPWATLRELEDPQARATQWFTAHPDTATRAFMVAAAALGGSSSIAVADAAALLYSELKGFRVRPERLDFWPALAEEPWLAIAQEAHSTPLGSLPVEVVRFRNERMQTAVLEHAWRRVDGMRLATSAWLRKLGATASTEIRARAGATAGIVALWDFEYALDNIVLGWAASTDAGEREAAALALSIPANDTRFSDATWRLVLGWCDPGLSGNSELTRTAIGALGGPLGAQDPDTALAALREVIEDHGWERVLDVATSLVVLAVGGRGPAVLSALLDWTRHKADPTPRDRELRLIGLSCFLIAASAYAAAPGEVSRPVILGSSGAGLRPSACLWGRALELPSVRAWALELLRAWIVMRDNRDADDGYVLDLIRAIAELDDRQRQRLEHHCYNWANDARYPSETAREALAFLRQPGVGAKSIT